VIRKGKREPALREKTSDTLYRQPGAIAQVHSYHQSSRSPHDQWYWTINPTQFDEWLCLLRGIRVHHFRKTPLPLIKTHDPYAGFSAKRRCRHSTLPLLHNDPIPLPLATPLSSLHVYRLLETFVHEAILNPPQGQRYNALLLPLTQLVLNSENSDTHPLVSNPPLFATF
jgi:hypothetical protein